jgi:hypothetical protein
VPKTSMLASRHAGVLAGKRRERAFAIRLYESIPRCTIIRGMVRRISLAIGITFLAASLLVADLVALRLAGGCANNPADTRMMARRR